MKPAQPVGMFDEASGQWKLTEQWTCALSDGRSLVVHPGALSDGASIPRVLWPFVGPKFAAATYPAAFCHDMLYAGELVKRSQADAEFRRLLRMFGVSAIKATAYWSAVRSFGWLVWAKHTRESVTEARMFAEIIGAVKPTKPNGALLESA